MKDAAVSRGVLVAFSEIGLRTPRVRAKLVKLLRRNLEHGLKWMGLDSFKIESRWERIFIFTNENLKVSKLIKSMPGIRFTAPIYYIDKPELEDIIHEVTAKALPILNGKKFKVETKRRFKGVPYTSMQISSMIGAKILEECEDIGMSTKVNLDNPDVTIHVELAKDYALFYFDRFEGFGGQPIGSQSPLVSLLSGGTDSTVATWLVLQRGCHVHPIFMDPHSFTGHRHIERVKLVLRKIKELALYPDMRLTIARIGDVLEEIARNVRSKNVCVHCKRLMVKVATKYAETVGARGLVTGESIGQVASQTIDNLFIISQATSLPIYRPLSGFSKEMIHDLARRIGLYDVTAVDVGYCDMLPQHPTTKGDLREILKEEGELELDSKIDQILSDLEFFK